METVVFSLQKHIRFVEFVASDEVMSNAVCLHRWIALVKALLLSRKKFTWIFSFLRKSQKTKKNIFLAPTAKNGFNGRNFYYT
jgi:hypothetical protein